MKILIVEDDLELASNIEKFLKKESFAVDRANSISKAQESIDINEYDCILLDIGLPDRSGFELLYELRGLKNLTPVIIITARGQIEDKVKGLNLGADDYIAKPFDSNELLARIHAVIRRNTNENSPVLTIGALTVTPAEHKAKVNQKILNLTAREFSILEYLAQHSGQIITRDMLMEHVWGSDFETFSNVIDVYIRNLRRSIEEQTDQTLIKTIRGKGYILSSDEIS